MNKKGTTGSQGRPEDELLFTKEILVRRRRQWIEILFVVRHQVLWREKMTRDRIFLNQDRKNKKKPCFYNQFLETQIQVRPRGNRRTAISRRKKE